MHIKATYTLNIFLAYHPNDKDKFDELFSHLKDLNKKNRGYRINKIWYDGSDLTAVGCQLIGEMTEAADIVLLLMSEASVLSPYFLSQEMRKTVQLHEKERSIVIPIILETCWWEDTVYKHLEVLPRAGLPIYDSNNLKNELFDQIIEEIDERLDIIRERKLELEETFKAKMEEADSIFEDWEKHPEKLRGALPLFKEALELWREGFIPTKEAIEKRISVCFREIDFRHYAKAAHEAFKEGDFQTTYFNCKDALELRDDAVMRALYQRVSSKLEAEEMKILKAPFDKHLNKGHDFFLSLQWKKAQEEYTLALEFHEEGFEPTKDIIEHKISICRREYILERSLIEAEVYYGVQDYQKTMEVLMYGIRQINNKAFDQIENITHLQSLLEHAETFRDQKTGKWGFYNQKNGNVIIAPKYTAAYDFSENLAAVKKWEKWGFIDIEGNEVIPFEYSFVGHFHGGIVDVIKEGKTFFIDHKGQPVDIGKGKPISPLQENSILPSRKDD